jgi:hypothetical protein
MSFSQSQDASNWTATWAHDNTGAWPAEGPHRPKKFPRFGQFRHTLSGELELFDGVKWLSFDDFAAQQNGAA